MFRSPAAGPPLRWSEESAQGEPFALSRLVPDREPLGIQQPLLVRCSWETRAILLGRLLVNLLFFLLLVSDGEMVGRSS